MKFEQFKKVLDTIRDFDKTITVIEDLNIGMIDSNICTDFWTLQDFEAMIPMKEPRAISESRTLRCMYPKN